MDKLATRMSASSGPGSESGECPGGSAGGGGPPLPVGSVSRVAEAFAERRKSATEEGAEGGEPRAGVKRAASVSGLSPPSGEHKVQRLESHGKLAPSSTATTTANTTVPTPAHTTPPHISSSSSSSSSSSAAAASALLSAIGRQRSGSVGEKSSPVQQRDSGEVGLDLSIPKDKGRAESASSAPLPPPRPDSRGRASPKDSNPGRSGSPAVGLDKVVSGTKFNGDSSKDKSHLENEVFKVPTPKTQSCEETEERGGVSGGGRTVNASPVCNANSRPFPAPPSPLSDASSPENELVIDCGEALGFANTNSRTGSSASSRAGAGSTPALAPVHPSPKRVVELVGEGVAPMGVGRTSPGSSSSGKVSPSPSARGGIKSSPQQSSAHQKRSPSLTSPSPAPNDTGANSPCEIDDDLMDAALMGFNAS